MVRVANEGGDLRALLRRGVPFVADQHHRAIVGIDQMRQPRILIRDALGRIDDEEQNIGAPNHLDRAAHRGLLEFALDARPATDSGRIDQKKSLALVIERRIDRIARGAGRRIDDRALDAREPIEQRRLADVGTSDQRDFQIGALGDFGFLRRKPRGDFFEQLADAVSMRRGQEENLFRAGGIEFRRRGLLSRADRSC